MTDFKAKKEDIVGVSGVKEKVASLLHRFLSSKLANIMKKMTTFSWAAKQLATLEGEALNRQANTRSKEQ